jgi:hypothetical protein
MVLTRDFPTALADLIQREPAVARLMLGDLMNATI